MEIDFDLVKQNQADLLIQSRRLLSYSYMERVKKPLILNSSEIELQKYEVLRARIRDYFKGYDKNIIYVITFGNNQEARKVQEWFRSKKGLSKEYAMSKINDIQESTTNVLYVGSSLGKTLISRMYGHFGVGCKTTYSMHMAWWLPEDLDVEVEVHLYSFSCKQHIPESINLLEIMEQGVWDGLKPIFGKRSGRL